MESKTESAHFYSRAFRFATHYPVRFRFYPRLSPFVPLGVGFSCPVPRLREGVPKVKASKRRRGRMGGPLPRKWHDWRPIRVGNRVAVTVLSGCCPGLWGLVSKAGPRPRPCVVGGPGRSRNALVLFFSGCGAVLFQKRMRPTSLRWKPSLAGAGNYAKAHGDAVRFLFSRNHDGCPSKFQALRKGK